MHVDSPSRKSRCNMANNQVYFAMMNFNQNTLVPLSLGLQIGRKAQQKQILRMREHLTLVAL